MTEHTSESAELTLTDVTFTFALVASGDQNAQVLIHVEHTTGGTEPMTVLLDPEFDVPALIGRLDTERNRAKYLSAPVIPEAVA